MIRIELLSTENFRLDSLENYPRKLFDVGKEEARKAGAEALYISACSSEETIAFYKAMGAELTDCPIKEIAEAEPYDLQMVCYV